MKTATNSKSLIYGFLSKDVLGVALLALVYFISGKFGLGLAFANPSATPVWAPTGIAIAAMLIFGLNVWPGVFIGAFLVNFTTTPNLLTSFGIATGNALEGMVAVSLVRRIIKSQNPFLKPGDILSYTLIAGAIAPMVSATIGVTSLLLGGFAKLSEFSQVWTTWYLGDLGGALIVAPVIILWKYYHRILYGTYKILERLFLLGILLIPPILVFSGFLPTVVTDYPIAFIPIPILVWIAFRFGPRETATSILILSALSIFGTLHGFGPFSRSDPNESLLIVQVFLSIMFLAVMPLSAAVFQTKQSEDRYKTLVDATPDPVVVIDTLGIIQFANQQAARTYGFSGPSDMIGVSGFDLIAPEEQKRMQKVLSDAVMKGKFINVEYTSLRKDGSKFLTSGSGSVLYDHDRKPEGVIGVVHDITEAKALDQAKSEFVDIASHQLRTPLGAMRWNLELVLKNKYGEVPSSLKEVIVDVHSSALRMIRMVNELLDITRIDKGRFAYNPKKVNIVSLVAGVVQDLKMDAISQSVDIELHPQHPNIEITIDELRLQQVIMNLVTNAILYNKKGGTVDIYVEAEDKSVQIKVADSGIGIKLADQDKIFTKFYRTKEASQKFSDGTGLGLYLVKSYIRKWGGSIDFTSQYLKGTTFKITLPRDPKPFT